MVVIFFLHAMQALGAPYLRRLCSWVPRQTKYSARNATGSVVLNRRLFVAKRIAGGDVFELGRRDDLAGQRFLDRLLFFAFEAKHVADLFPYLPVGT